MKSYLEIKEKIKRGDIDTVSKMLNITPANASKALVREGSKHHEKIINALSKVVEMREMLIQESAEA